MDSEILTWIIGILASVLVAVSLIPQLRRVMVEKKAEDVSLSTLIILFAAQALWIWYGILKQDWIIIGSNVFSMAVNCLTILYSARYKSRG